MERLVIIDHYNHIMYVEDVSEEMLKRYRGEEEAYIMDNYDLKLFSWDYVTEAHYIPMTSDGDPIEINFERLNA